MSLLSALPAESFATISLRRIRAPRLVWRNTALLSEERAFHLACCARLDGEDENVFSAEPVQAYADRYGGQSIGFHGGSARCAEFDGVQIKGVGRTPLYGQSSNTEVEKWHSNGALSVHEAVREVIWSEICSVLLPHSAVRNLSIFLTGSVIKDGAVTEDDGVVPYRALLLREPAVRPAHLLRNINFERSTGWDNSFARDGQRVRGAFHSFQQHLRPNSASKDSSLAADFASHLNLTGIKFADQIAASFARRIFHRALSCSNIALNGRFLDFGVMTSVAAYRRLAGSPQPAGQDQWNQSQALLVTLRSLVEHGQRHVEGFAQLDVNIENWILNNYRGQLLERTAVEMLRLTGLTERQLGRINREARYRLFRAMQQIYMQGAQERYVLRRHDCGSVAGMAPLQKHGAYDLTQVMYRASESDNDDDIIKNIAPLLKDGDYFLRFFSRAYLDIMTAARELFGATSMVEARSRARAMNSDLTFLSNSAIDEEISKCGNDANKLSNLISELLHRSREYMLAWQAT